MNKEQIRLLNNLKTNPTLKERIERLEFGCMIYVGKKYCPTLKLEKHIKGNDDYIHYLGNNHKGNFVGAILKSEKDFYEIIGQATFIDLLYFLNHSTYGYILDSVGGLYQCVEDNEKYIIPDIEFDATRELLEQSEEVLKQLNEFLESEFNI